MTFYHKKMTRASAISPEGQRVLCCQDYSLVQGEQICKWKWPAYLRAKEDEENKIMEYQYFIQYKLNCQNWVKTEQVASCDCNSCELSFYSGKRKLFHKQDKESHTGNACPPRGRLISGQSCCNKDIILPHWGTLLEFSILHCFKTGNYTRFICL